MTDAETIQWLVRRVNELESVLKVVAYVGPVCLNAEGNLAPAAGVVLPYISPPLYTTTGRPGR